jgi:hypothetical protein
MNKTETWIRDRLLKHGERLFHAPKQRIEFTGNSHADRLLNDLDYHPHAFVLGCVMDRQIKAEKARIIPYRFKQKLRNFEMNTLTSLSEGDVRRLMAKPEPLHRFVDDMSTFFFSGVRRIAGQYQSDASKIWNDTPSSADVVYRFLEFDGIGPKIASMAANVLARDFKVPFRDYYSIDISADVHVRRVFGRLGLASPDATVEQLIFRARALHPQFPGLLDFPSWEIGRNWCRPHKPQCRSCYMKSGCLAAKNGKR